MTEEIPPKAILDALLSRASISSLQEPAPAGHELDLILASGMCAPDHGRLRPWRFVLIRGSARERFAGTVIDVLKLEETVAPSLISRQRSRLANAPLIIALGARLQPGSPIPEIEQMLSVGAAAMNMLNAVHGLGYGGIWVTGAMTYDPALPGVLGLESSDRLAGFLFIGTPKEAPGTMRRPDVANHVTEWTGNGTVSPFAVSAPS